MNHVALQFAMIWVAAFAAAQESGQKLPIPDAEAQETALELVNNVFESDFDSAQTTEQRIALAKKMLDVGASTKNDPAGQYVLLRIALKVAAGQGDLETVERALLEVRKSFQIDEIAFTAEALSITANSTRSPGGHEMIVARALTLMDRAVKDDRYLFARQAGMLAVASARETKNSDLVKRVQSQVDRTERIAISYSEVSDALAVLEDRPTDADANLAAGKFYGMEKGDWEKGLPMLALGSDPKLAELAKAELNAPQDAKQRLKLADAWWDLAEQSEGNVAIHQRARAGYWYGQAVDGLTGLSKEKAQRRLDEQAEASAKAAAFARPSPLPQQEITLVGAAFGAGDRQTDVTEIVHKALTADPFTPVQADDRVMGDPAPGVGKQLLIAFRVDTRKYNLMLGQLDVATIPGLPPEGLRIRDASREFRILAARYGAGMTWHDVTATLRERLKNPGLEYFYSHENVAGDLADPWFGIPKSTAVWFDYGGRRFVRIIKQDESRALLP